MPRADLADFDPLFRSIGRGERWFEPPLECEGGPRAGGRCEQASTIKRTHGVLLGFCVLDAFRQHERAAVGAAE